MAAVDSEISPRWRFAAMTAIAFAVVMATNIGQARGGASAPDLACRDKAEPLAITRFDEGEPSVKVPQRNPDRLVATWTVSSGQASPLGGAVVLGQRDPSGRWSQEVLGPHVFSGDSTIDTAPNGSVYVANLAVGGLVRRVWPGRPAGTPFAVPTGDHPTLAVDQVLRKPDGDHLFVVSLEGLFWGPGVLWTSRTGGHRWSGPTYFPDLLPGYAGPGLPTIASGGKTIMASWFEENRTDGDVAIRAARIDPATGIFTPGGDATVANFAGAGGIYFGGRYQPSISIVRGGPYDGRAYVAWMQGRADGTAQDIYVSYWDATSGVWSSPLRVNDDGEAANNHEYPSIAAAPDGSAYVAWMDTRDDPTRSTALIYAARVTPDGQVEPNHRLTNCPTYQETRYLHTLGDYFNGDASQGKPVWTFPKIDAQGQDSDVFLIESRHRP